MSLEQWLWALTSSSRKSPMFDHLFLMLLYVQSELPLAQALKKIFLCILSLDFREKRLVCLSSLPLLRKLYKTVRSTLSLLFFKIDKPRLLSHSSQDIFSCPFTSFVSLSPGCKDVLNFLKLRPRTACSTPNEVTAMLNTLIILTGWWCCVWCTFPPKL